MAGNFWQSSHYTEWILTKQDIYLKRQQDLLLLTEDDYQKVMIFFANFIQAIGESVKVRQQVIATATVYFKRFYARNTFKCIDPFLMSPTCIFLASKVEEFGMISTNKIQSACCSIIKNKLQYAFKQEYPYRTNHILECEFFLLEMMDCCLIVYQPYRPLTEYCAELNDDSVLSLAWKVVNDSLRTDASLLYPPYLIALAAMHLACVMLQKDCHKWFAELSVDFDKVMEVMQLLLSLYDLWKEGYDEKKDIYAILEKVPKPKTTPNPTR